MITNQNALGYIYLFFLFRTREQSNFSAPNLPTGLADLNVVVRASRVYNSALVLNLPFYSLGLYSIRQTVIIFSM